MLMPMPVQRMARSLGKREISMSSSDSISPESTSAGVMSAAPTKSERTLISVSSTRRMQVDRVIETNVPQRPEVVAGDVFERKQKQNCTEPKGK